MLPSFAIMCLVSFVLCVQGDPAANATNPNAINSGGNNSSGMSDSSSSEDDDYPTYNAVGVSYCQLQSLNLDNPIINARMIDGCNYECLYQYSIYYDGEDYDIPFKRSINRDERSVGMQKRSADKPRQVRSAIRPKREADNRVERMVGMQKRSADKPRQVRSAAPIRPKREADKVRRFMEPSDMDYSGSNKMNISLSNLESCGNNSEVCYSGMCSKPSAALQPICDNMGTGYVAINSMNTSPCSGMCVMEGINTTYPSSQMYAQLPIGVKCNTSPDMMCTTDGLCLNSTRFVNKCM